VRTGFVGTRGDDRGAVATEFVVLIPIFLTMVFGMVWAGTTFLRYMNLELAAREGARYGATLPTGFPDDTDMSGAPDRRLVRSHRRPGPGSVPAPRRICVAYSGLLASDDADESGSRPANATSGTRAVVGSFESGTCFDDGRRARSRRVQVETEGPCPSAGSGSSRAP
jgi:hypothetical protein